MLMVALQQNYVSRMEATESSLTQAEICERSLNEMTSTSSLVTTIGWIMIVTLSFMIGRHHAKMQRSAPPLHKLGAAATKSYEPPKETKTPQEGKTEEEEEESGRPDEPEVTTRAVATQSQCAYTRHLTQPRFKVLPESGSGAYAG